MTLPFEPDLLQAPRLRCAPLQDGRSNCEGSVSRRLLHSTVRTEFGQKRSRDRLYETNGTVS